MLQKIGILCIRLQNNAYQMKNRLTYGHRGGPAAQEVPYGGSSLNKMHIPSDLPNIMSFAVTFYLSSVPDQHSTNQASWPAAWIQEDMNETFRNLWYITKQTRKARKVTDKKDLDDITVANPEKGSLP